MEDDNKTASPEVEAASLAKLEAETEQAWAEAARIDLESARIREETRKARAAADSAELELARELRSERRMLCGDTYHHTYYFSDSVDDLSVHRCMSQLATWQRMAKDDAEKPAIEIVITSPGGDVIAGMVLYDFIQTLRRAGHHVTTNCLGMAASMGGILLQAGDRRVMGKEAYLLIHEITFGAGGKIGEIEDEIAFGKKIQSRILRILADRSTMSEKSIARRWERKDWWLDSDEALALGFVDEVR